MTLDEIKKGSDSEIVVLVDTDTSKENVTPGRGPARAAGARMFLPRAKGIASRIEKG